MKTIIKTAFFISVISFTTIGCSQKTTQGVKDTANKAGNKTAEIAAKGAAQITDKVYEGKIGPDGQTIYIDENSKYFYIDNKGHRVFIKESKLRNKEN